MIFQVLLAISISCQTPTTQSEPQEELEFLEFLEWREILAELPTRARRIKWTAQPDFWLSSGVDLQARAEGLSKQLGVEKEWSHFKSHPYSVFDEYLFVDGEREHRSRQLVSGVESWTVIKEGPDVIVRREYFDTDRLKQDMYSLCGYPGGIDLAELWESGSLEIEKKGGTTNIYNLIGGGERALILVMVFSPGQAFPSQITLYGMSRQIVERITFSSPEMDGSDFLWPGMAVREWFGPKARGKPSMIESFELEVDLEADNHEIQKLHPRSIIFLDDMKSRRIEYTRLDDSFRYQGKKRALLPSIIFSEGINWGFSLALLLLSGVLGLKFVVPYVHVGANQWYFRVAVLAFPFVLYGVFAPTLNVMKVSQSSVRGSVDIEKQIDISIFPDLILPLTGDVSIPYSPYAGNCGYWAVLGVAHTYLNLDEFAKSARAHLAAGTEEMSLSEVIESAESVGLKTVVTSGLFSPQSATGVVFLALMDNPEEGGKHWIAVEAEGGDYKMLEPKVKTALNPELVGEKCILSVVLLRNDGYVLSVNRILSVLVGLLLFPVAFFFRRRSIK